MWAVTLRRFRPDSVGAFAALLGLAALALVTGMQMSDQFHSSGLAECLTRPAADCEALRDQFGRRFESLQVLIVPLVVLPALLGAFVGAPVVARELEHGSHRFLWTQGVTRARWLAATAFGALALAAVTGAAYAAIAARWLDVTNRVTGERFGRLYDFQGVVPIAASVFAVAVGIAAGVVLRRTVPAMVATAGVYVVVRLFLGTQVRPRLAAPVTVDVPGFSPESAATAPAGWILSQRTLTADGMELGRGGGLNLANIGTRCPDLDLRPGSLPDRSAVDRCLDLLGVHQVTRYHPASRFWTFQLIESGILIALAGLSMAVAASLLPRRSV
ncbi:MAG: ABC transporter permease subunit [Acidimicrobiia bacterium]